MNRLAYLVPIFAAMVLMLGLYGLFARYIGGPEYYLRQPGPPVADEAAEKVERSRKNLAEAQAMALASRKQLESLPAETGAERRKQIEELATRSEASVTTWTHLLDNAEMIHRASVQADESRLRSAHRSTARMGWIGTVLGLLWLPRSLAFARRVNRPAETNPSA